METHTNQPPGRIAVNFHTYHAVNLPQHIVRARASNSAS
jgi:hypothetical protein